MPTPFRWCPPGFQIGYRDPLQVRIEKIGDHPDPCRVAYVSDIHLRSGRSQLLSEQVIDALKLAEPDLILFGGDLVDFESEIPAMRSMLNLALDLAPAFAIPGNHDINVGENLVRDTVVETGGAWIQNRTADFHHGQRRIAVSGPGADPDSTADVRILCEHYPSAWWQARHAGFDLVLAGHLHACQAALFEAWGRLFPGAFFYPHNFKRWRHGDSHLIVSHGCVDLLPIRWGCPRELLLCLL
ncbi:MAG: metallophosphoesterase [Verrucomicrobiota bacterium]